MGKTEISVLLLFLSCSLGAVVDIFGHVRSFADRKKQPVIQSYIFAPVKKNGVLTRINVSVINVVLNVFR